MSNAVGSDSRAQLLDGMPPALRAAVESCPFDLLPWIDPAGPVPQRPILSDLDAYAIAENPSGVRLTRKRHTAREAVLASALSDGMFFDASDLTAPRIQYVVWRLLNERRFAEGSVYEFLLRLRRFVEWLRSTGKLAANPFAWSAGELTGTAPTWNDIARAFGVSFSTVNHWKEAGAPIVGGRPNSLEAIQKWKEGSRQKYKGTSLRDWKCGELPDIKRIHSRAWHWLHQDEDFDSPETPTGGNRWAILDEWNRITDEGRKRIDPEHWQALPASTSQERLKSNRLIGTYIAMARAIRDNPPGVDFLHPPKKTKGSGSATVRHALFAWWKGTGLSTSQLRARWNAFPIKVWGAIAGNNAKVERKIPPGRRGRIMMHRRSRSSQAGCKGGGLCPRARAFLRASESGQPDKEGFAAYKRLTPEERAKLCAVHVRTPLNLKQYRREISAARAARDGGRKWPNLATFDHRERRPCWRRDCIFKRLRARGKTDGEIAVLWNAKPARMKRICPGRPVPVTAATVDWAIRKADEDDNPAAALESFRSRPGRAFDLWCEERVAALQSPSKVLDELLELPAKEQRERFGSFDHGVSRVPGNRTAAVDRIRAAVGRARKERMLASLAAQSAENQTPADPLALDLPGANRRERKKAETPADPLALDLPGANRRERKKAERLGKALITLRDHPEWSDRRIAREAGYKSHAPLVRDRNYQQARKLVLAPKKTPRRGRKTGDGDVEAWEDDEQLD